MHTHHEVNFSTDVEGLEEATSPEVIRLRDGETHEITIKPVRKRIGDAEVRMLGYNGSIPGPTLHVDQDSEVTIEATNLGDVDATLHWHGLRLENRFDGVPEETQAPIPHGGKFTYRLQFPDPGFYWYHPHIREDFAQEMGLYAGIIVEPEDPDYWPPVDRQLAITLDDILIEDGQIAPFDRSGPTFTAMGRFGNVMLTNGETDYRAEAKVGEVVRLHLVDTANTRIFNFGISGARMKLVGGDSGRVEREEFIDEVLLSPSERAIVDVLFDQPGEVILENRTPDHTYELGRITVSGEAAGEAAAAFDELRVDPELSAERERIQADLEREPDKTLAFVSQMPILYGGEAERGLVLRLPDASRGHRLRGIELSQVRDEAGPGRVGADLLRLPDASRGHGIRAGHLPEVRDEAGAGGRVRADLLCLPDAPRGHRHRGVELSQVRDEAGPGRQGRRRRRGRVTSTAVTSTLMTTLTASSGKT